MNAKEVLLVLYAFCVLLCLSYVVLYLIQPLAAKLQ